MKLLLFKCFLIFSFIANCQDLTGTWLKIRKPNVITTPLIEILKFTKDSLTHYDFLTKIRTYKISIDDKTISFNDSLSANYKLKEANALEISPVKTFDEKNIASNVTLVRLLPTIDSLKLIDSITSNDYIFTIKDLQNRLKFRAELTEDEFIYFDGSTSLANKVSIDKWDEIYFLSFYFNQYRIYAFPINKINSDAFSIYGVPGRDGLVMVNKIIK